MDPGDSQCRSLQRLLALKRHERPPPGYFDRLPGRIQCRLIEQPEPDALGWLGGLLAGFQLRPAALGLFAVLVSCTYLLGFSASRDLVRQSWQAQAMREHLPGPHELAGWQSYAVRRAPRNQPMPSTAPVFSAGYPDPFRAFAPGRLGGAIAPASYQPSIR
ncbi:MAG TPA: hypothetical protein PKM73_07835 [Verrucomicrobiota bacterium]|nr:hypothetical protein [Verrucomicrobiota bacterium]HNU51741.1 hypothetical protein [Verrucomicrobiota bacterium]